MIDAVLPAKVNTSRTRPARRGEFTLRKRFTKLAKLDLQAERRSPGVIDAADAAAWGVSETALRQLAGGLSTRISAVRDDLLNLLADLEAGLDFVDEDIEFVSSDETVARLTSAAQVITEIERGARERLQSRTQARVVLAGLPNAGKSTLFNALLERDAAIVSDQSGTTRDYLSATTRWGQLEVELVDTAGWELDQSGIESLAQHFRDEQVRDADVVVWCSSAILSDSMAADDRKLCSLLPNSSRVIRVVTQCDRASTSSVDGLVISAVTGAGLASLRKRIVDRLVTDASETGELLGSTAARSRTALQRAIERLDAGREAAELSAGDELVAVEIREAIASLGEVVGAVYTDDLLDRIFSRFCIGK